MPPETARPAIWDSRPGLDDFRVAAESRSQVTHSATDFNYASLPADVANEARAAAARIKTRLRAAVVDVGADLNRVKERLPYGEFGSWLKAEFGLTERTAQNYMSAAVLAGKYETVSVLPPKTLYLLAAPSTPESAQQEVVGRLQRGESLDHREVKSVIDDAKHEQEQERRRAEDKAKLAKLSPRARKSRAERQAERQRQEEEYRERQAMSEAAAKKAAALIVDAVGERAAELSALLEELPGMYLSRALWATLGLDGRGW